MIAQPQGYQEGKGAAEKGNGAAAPRDDWLEKAVTVGPTTGNRFPLEWIGEEEHEELLGAEHEKPQQRKTAPRGWWAREVILLGLALAWLSGFLMGVFLGGAVGHGPREAMQAQQNPMAEQMALSSGYRAILFKSLKPLLVFGRSGRALFR